ncbi:hypothetical protein ABH946_005947 [Bacillus sp. RC145]|uniref:hypothetical protein n=1 Tax=Bacillus sp. RC145 TaxID=3156280 RepID=UPI003832D065
MKSFKRVLETEEIKAIVDELYNQKSFQDTIDEITREHDIKLSRYKVEVAESWTFAPQKTMKILILSYCNGEVEMMYALQDNKEIVSFTLLLEQKIIVA